MPNSIAQRKNYTNILDEVYQQAACSTCLNSGRGMVRAGAHAHEIHVTEDVSQPETSREAREVQP